MRLREKGKLVAISDIVADSVNQNEKEAKLSEESLPGARPPTPSLHQRPPRSFSAYHA